MPSDVLHVASYYHTPGARSLAHRIKGGDAEAITQAGREMARLVPPDAVLVPIPGRTGTATTARLLAEEIARLLGVGVADVLQGPPRESVYEMKRRGGTPSSAALGFRRVGELPAGKVPVLIDNVVATGTTAAAALALVPGAKVLVHSIAVRRRLDPGAAPPRPRTPPEKRTRVAQRRNRSPRPSTRAHAENTRCPRAPGTGAWASASSTSR